MIVCPRTPVRILRVSCTRPYARVSYFFFYTIRESTPKWIHRFDERTRSIILSTVYLFMTRNAIHNRRTYSSSVRAFAGFFLNLTFPARSTVLGSASIVRGWPQAHREIHSWKFSSSPLNPLLYKTRCEKFLVRCAVRLSIIWRLVNGAETKVRVQNRNDQVT